MTEYMTPSGVRYQVVSATPVQTTEADGTPVTMWTVKAHRWVKSRNGFAKTITEFSTRRFPEWSKR